MSPFNSCKVYCSQTKTAKREKGLKMNTTNQMHKDQQESEKIDGTIRDFFKTFRIGQVLNRSGIQKAKGASALTIMMSLFSLVFTGIPGRPKRQKYDFFEHVTTKAISLDK